MSTNLYWRLPGGEKTLPYALKKHLGRKLWGHDGSLSGHDVEVGTDVVEYLEGLRDAGVEGADQLLCLIEKHGSVIVSIQS